MSPARPVIPRISPLRARVLERVAFDPITRPEDAIRASSLLLASQGVSNETLAREFSRSPTTTRAWRRAFDAQGIASFAGRAKGAGRPASIPGLELKELVEAIARNDRLPEPASTRELSARLGVSASTVTRVRADLRIAPEGRPLPRHRLVEIAGALLTADLAAIALVLDPVTSRAFLRSRRGPHMNGTCPGGLVAAMTALDVLRPRTEGPARGREGEEERLARAEGEWEEFLLALLAERPPGAHLHIVASGPFDLAEPAAHLIADREAAGEPVRRAELLRIRRVPAAAWSHGRLTLLARVLRSAPARGAFDTLPELLRSLDASLEKAERRAGRASLSRSWVLSRPVLEARARASRADLIERIREFSPIQTIVRSSPTSGASSRMRSALHR